jgi:hypothetical protein
MWEIEDDSEVSENRAPPVPGWYEASYWDAGALRRIVLSYGKSRIPRGFPPREIRWNSGASPATLVKQMKHPTFIA